MAKNNKVGLINGLPASPSQTRQIGYIMTKALRDNGGNHNSYGSAYKI
jgi:hypothetical protein